MRCFPLCIVADLFSSVIFICLGLALYRLLSSVNKMWAGAMVALVHLRHHWLYERAE
jgi:hypothetical protein